MTRGRRQTEMKHWKEYLTQREAQEVLDLEARREALLKKSVTLTKHLEALRSKCIKRRNKETMG